VPRILLRTPTLLFVPLLAVGCVLLLSSTAEAVFLHQIDNFQDGTTQNWADGHVAGPMNHVPVNVSTGGPAGAGDKYLKITGDGSGAGGKIVTFNRSQWLGNYSSNGITGIEMDLENLGASTLSMRIGIKQSTAGAGDPGYVTTVAFSLPADSAWHHAVFGLDAASLTAINSPEALSTLLAGPAEVRIINSAAPSLTGDVCPGSGQHHGRSRARDDFSGSGRVGLLPGPFRTPTPQGVIGLPGPGRLRTSRRVVIS
jgi:hypothetical protein